MRRSTVTGTARVPHWLGGLTPLLLRDGAEAVPVASRDSWNVIVAFPRADGKLWSTFCYCGPEAPFPRAYPREVPACLELCSNPECWWCILDDAVRVACPRRKREKGLT